ncbi:MAG: hypothetical protein IJ474_04595 [Mailhella sp.]|nr:hypothetical protein [Mailhella sp.]
MSEKVSVLDCITSFVDGRVRLRHPALKDAATAELVRSVVGEVAGITSAQVNPVTGSLLIYYDPEMLSREQLLELAEQAAAFLPAVDETVPADAPAAEPGGDDSCGTGGRCGNVVSGLTNVLSSVLPAPVASGIADTLPKILPAVTGKAAELPPVDEALKLLTSRGLTTFVNRGMLAALGVTLAALPMRRMALHTIAGGILVGGVLQHLLAHRKSL